MSGTCWASLAAKRAREPAGRGGGAAVEALDTLVALGGAAPRRSRSGSSAGVTSAPARGQRGAQRVVVGRRVGRGIDDVDAHETSLDPAPPRGVSNDARPAQRSRHTVRRSVRRAGRRSITCSAMALELSYCVVNTERRSCCCAAWTRSRASATLGFATEVLVLDNASTDGSAGAARHHPATTELIALDKRRGKGENDTDAAAARARALLPAAQRGLRAAAGRDRRRCATRWTRDPRPPPPARACCGPTAAGSRRRGASRRR